MKKTLIYTLMLVACFSLSRPAMADVITLRIHHFLGTDSLVQKKLLEPFAMRVEKASKGRLKIEIHPDMGLGGKAWNLVDQVNSGVVDMVWTAAAYTPGRFGYTEVFSLPIVHQGDAVATNLAIRELLNKELYHDYKGMHPLLVHVHAGHVFHMNKKAVTGLEDFKELVVRPPGRKGIAPWLIEAMGASPTKKRHPKLAKALKEQQLDGALMSFRLAHSMGVVDAVASHTLYGEGGSFGTSLYMFLMNEKRYASLPDDLKAVIDAEAGVALSKEIGEIWQQGAQAGLAAAKKRGNKVHILTQESRAKIRDQQLNVLSRWAKLVDQKTIDGLQLIRKARQAVERNAKKK